MTLSDSLRYAADHDVTDLPGLLTAAAHALDRLVQDYATSTGQAVGAVETARGLGDATGAARSAEGSGRPGAPSDTRHTPPIAPASPQTAPRGENA